MGTGFAAVAAAEAFSVGRTSSDWQPRGADGHPVRAQDGNGLGRPALRDGLRVRGDLLASAARLAASGRLAGLEPVAGLQVAGGRPHRLV